MKAIARRSISLLAGLATLVAGVYALAVLGSEPAPEFIFFAAKNAGTDVIAHRGGAALRPENTLAAFSHAATLGADILEMDVHLSADGTPVVIHDATLERTTNGAGRVDSMTLAQLQSLDAGHRWTADGGNSYPFRDQGVRIPALEEVFARHGELRMVVEMKRPGEAMAAALCAQIRRSRMTGKVLAATFDVPTLEVFRRLCPEVATALGADEARRFVFGAFLSLSAGFSPAAPALLVPYSLGGTTIARPQLISAAQGRRLKVQVWTVNDEAHMRELLRAGVDGIMTDRPDRLLAVRGAR